MHVDVINSSTGTFSSSSRYMIVLPALPIFFGGVRQTGELDANVLVRKAKQRIITPRAGL
jgi:hypothetical protein